MRDFSTDLAILFTGTGKTTMKNLQDNLENWIFGTGDGRELKIILPVFSTTGFHVKIFMEWAEKILGEEIADSLIIVRTENAPMVRSISALPEKCFTICTTDQETLEKSLLILEKYAETPNETAFIMQYNPESVYKRGESSLSDREIIGEAKHAAGLMTLNISLGLQDIFEGYESEEDRESREMLEDNFKAAEALKEFERKVLAGEVGGAVTEKPPVTRKRAAKKPMAPKDPEPVTEPEKGTESLPVGTVVEVAGLEFTKIAESPFPVDSTSLSATVPLVVTRELGDNLVEYVQIFNGEEQSSGPIRTDILLPDSPVEESMTVNKKDMLELAQHVEQLTKAFSGFIATYTRMMEGQDV
jgi:hypothetical protein